MKTIMIKGLMLMLCIGVLFNVANAQSTKKNRHSVKRKKTAHKTTAARTPALKPTPVDTAVVIAPPPVDSIPIPLVKKSLRPETALDNHNTLIADRTPLPYQNLRAEDAVYDERLWLEIDTREKINLPFRYSADED
ncbi:MAG: hypothetical protein ABI185_06190, partial [Ginsengibacter sp.]